MTKGSEQLYVCSKGKECKTKHCAQHWRPHKKHGGCVIGISADCPACIPVEPEKKCCGTCDNYNSDEMKCILSGYSTTYSAEVDKDKCWIPKVIKGGNFSKEPEKKEEKVDCEYYQGTEKDKCYMFYKADCRNCKKYIPKGTGKAVGQGVEEILNELHDEIIHDNTQLEQEFISTEEYKRRSDNAISKAEQQLESFFRKEFHKEIEEVEKSLISCFKWAGLYSDEQIKDRIKQKLSELKQSKW